MLEKYCHKIAKVSNGFKSHSHTLKSWKYCSVCILWYFEPIGFPPEFPGVLRGGLCCCFCPFYLQPLSALLICEVWLPTHTLRSLGSPAHTQTHWAVLQ